MNFEIEKKEGFAVVRVTTEKLDSQISPALKSELVVLNADDFKNIIIDLSETRYCDSSGLSAILVANRLCKNSHGTFVLCGLQRSVSKLISISQLDTILNITPTLAEAIDFLAMEEVERDLDNEE
ncbi:MAG: STAS domain-containing protein [Flavobacteriales bacterium]|nr:STAS domain-containing protein [Flavobacteriales bacterium]